MFIAYNQFQVCVTANDSRSLTRIPNAICHHHLRSSTSGVRRAGVPRYSWQSRNRQKGKAQQIQSWWWKSHWTSRRTCKWQSMLLGKTGGRRWHTDACQQQQEKGKRGINQVTHAQTEHLLTCISGTAHWDRAFHLPRRMVSYHHRVVAPAQQQNIINLTTAPGSIDEALIFLLAFFYFTLLLFLVFDGSWKSNWSVFVC